MTKNCKIWIKEKSTYPSLKGYVVSELMERNEAHERAVYLKKELKAAGFDVEIEI